MEEVSTTEYGFAGGYYSRDRFLSLIILNILCTQNKERKKKTVEPKSNIIDNNNKYYRNKIINKYMNLSQTMHDFCFCGKRLERYKSQHFGTVYYRDHLSLFEKFIFFMNVIILNRKLFICGFTQNANEFTILFR